MSTADFRALDRDFRVWSQDIVTQSMARLEHAKEVRERMLFSAWINTLRDEWDRWCRDYERRGPC